MFRISCWSQLNDFHVIYLLVNSIWSAILKISGDSLIVLSQGNRNYAIWYQGVVRCLITFLGIYCSSSLKTLINRRRTSRTFCWGSMLTSLSNAASCSPNGISGKWDIISWNVLCFFINIGILSVTLNFDQTLELLCRECCASCSVDPGERTRVGLPSSRFCWDGLYPFRWVPLFQMWSGAQNDGHFSPCSCLRVVLDILDSLSKREVNAGLHELGFQVSIGLFLLRSFEFWVLSFGFQVLGLGPLL